MLLLTGPHRRAFLFTAPPQAEGIPQGSVLSGLLCNYFFGHIEKILLGGVLETLPPCTSRPPPPPDTGANHQAATTAGYPFRGGSGGGSGDGEDGVRGHALGWDSGAAAGAPSSRDRRPQEGSRPVRSSSSSGAAGRNLTRQAAEGAEEGEQDGDEEDDDGCGAGARGAGRATRNNPSRRSRDAETDRAPPGRAGGTPSSGVFPDPEGDCTLLRQVDDFLLVSTGERRPVPRRPSWHACVL